jgi:hypothetical protein
MKRRFQCLTLALVPLLLPLAASADPNPIGMSYLRTDDLLLVYFDQLDFLGPHTVRTFTNSKEFQKKTFGFAPEKPTVILLKDLSDYGNAATIVAPRNRLVVDIAPLSHAFETYPASDRMYTLMNHEMVHVVEGAVEAEQDRRWRNFFRGTVAPQSQYPESILYNYLTVPRYTAPRWYLEGAAVFMETWMGGGLGRAQGGYDEMVFRAMVRDNAHFYDPLGLVSVGVRVDFQIGANSYLYGTRFFTYLAYHYSPQQVVAWLRRDEGSARYYADQFQLVFGVPLEQAWGEWIKFEHSFQMANLAAVREHPITPETRLTGAALGSVSRMYYDEATGVIYAAFRYPGIVEHVGALNTRDGSLRRLADIKRAMLYRVASFAYDPSTGTAFYTNDSLALRDLMAVDVKTGESRMLLEDARIGEMVLNPVDRALIGVRHDRGIASLVRVPYPYREWFVVHEFPYGVVPSDLDISADGRLLSASMDEVNGEQFLRVWQLDKILEGDLRPLSEFRFGQSVPESFVFTKDGRYLYGASYYTGVSNIFRYEVATGDIKAVSNAESGFFRPVPLADGRLLVLSYTAAGFVPAIIDPKPLEDVSAIKFLGAEVAELHPIVKTWQVPGPSTVDDKKLVTAKGNWVPLDNLALDNAFPVLQGYKNSIGAGYHLNFADPLGFAKVGVTAAYTPTGHITEDERSHVEVTGDYLGWRGAAAWNRSDFYDLFGPTKRSRKGDAFKVGYDDLLIYDEPRRLTMKYDLSYFDKIDTLPYAQNVTTTFTRLAIGELGLYYTDVRRSLGAVDDEKGIAWSLVGDASEVQGKTIPQLRGGVAFGAQTGAHTSIWLFSDAGLGGGDRTNPVANYYFGGFGNNYVDSGSIKRYHDYSSMPGFGINEIAGQSFVREVLEFNVPPFAFDAAGTPAFHAAWLRPSLFVAGLWTDPGRHDFRRDYQDVGVQTDLHFSVLHWSELTLSLGYAVGFTEGKRSGDEFMISLKILER